MLNHPESKNYGLDCDYNLWSEFNKELLIRRWITSTREYDYMPVKVEGIEVDAGSKQERMMAEAALDELVGAGFLNPITYLKAI